MLASFFIISFTLSVVEAKALYSFLFHTSLVFAEMSSILYIFVGEIKTI